MKKNKNISLEQWGQQFSPDQKNWATQQNKYHQVVTEFNRLKKSLGLNDEQLTNLFESDQGITLSGKVASTNNPLKSFLVFAESMGKKLKISFV